MYTYTKHMYTLVHKRIYETEKACQHYETALCQCILDVNHYRAHQETSLKEEIKTANLINTFHKTHYSQSSEKKSTFLLGSYFSIVKNKKRSR